MHMRIDRAVRQRERQWKRVGILLDVWLRSHLRNIAQIIRSRQLTGKAPSALRRELNCHTSRARRSPAGSKHYRRDSRVSKSAFSTFDPQIAACGTPIALVSQCPHKKEWT